MYSIAFPNMFSTTYTNLVQDNEATKSNLALLLNSDKGALFGDPEFGTILRQYLYDQRDDVVFSILREKIYLAIKEFMPQIIIERNDIKATAADNKSLTLQLTFATKLDYKTDMYSIKLNSDEIE